jgi:hypothetical protein
MNFCKVAKIDKHIDMKKIIVLGSSKSVDDFASIIAETKNVELSGYFDPDDSMNYDMFGDFIKSIEIIQRGDIFIIGEKADNIDLGVVSQMIKFGKHIFVEGFRNWSLFETEQLEKLRFESQTTFQFSNTLFSLPIFTTAQQFVKKPRFIKLEKHCQAPKPGHFEQWIFQQMVQELDLICRLMDCGIRHISARPMFLFGEHTDLLNIHIEFDNDAICHVSLGRAIPESTHSLKIYQHEKLFHVDFSNNQLTESRLATRNDQLSLDISAIAHQSTDPSEIITLERSIMPYDARKMEFRNFLENIDKKLTPLTNLSHLQSVADLCEVICEKVKRRYQTV